MQTNANTETVNAKFEILEKTTGPRADLLNYTGEVERQFIQAEQDKILAINGMQMDLDKIIEAAQKIKNIIKNQKR